MITLFNHIDSIGSDDIQITQTHLKTNLSVFQGLFLPLILLMVGLPTRAQDKQLDHYPITNISLWLDYTPKATIFKMWSPPAKSVQLLLYKNGSYGAPFATHTLQPQSDGLWSLNLEGDWNGTYYTYQVTTGDGVLNETPGIYAQAVGVNGKRAMVLNLESTNPEGWATDKGPQLNHYNDAIIYEAHVRDLSMAPNSGIEHKGKYLGWTETGTEGPHKVATGIDHIQEMGVTHVHLLPTYDFFTIDETKLDTPQYNWGYDPLNYNVPEGSYATDPYQAEVRIKEFKQMVKALHDKKLGVILDVVFNHTFSYDNSNFNREVPRYYYRHNADGTPSNASACGNEVASEREMVRRFIVASVSYWAKEYHVDGFRFDLMAVLDVETMNQVSKALKAINPNIIIYGEGWAAGDSPYDWKQRAFKFNVPQMQGVAAFSDELRDGLKGSVFEESDLGFVSGKKDAVESVKMGIVGCVAHPQIDNQQVNASKEPWTTNPWQAMMYVTCHDNLTLYDKLTLSRPDATEAERIAMDQLANAIVLTSQGTAFIHAGVELLRSKQGVENSYKSPDSINQIDWSLKAANRSTVKYYQNLIALRKAHPAFRMATGDEVRKHLEFKTQQGDLISYQISDHANGDTWKNIYVIYNASPKVVDYTLPGTWKLAVFGNDFKTNKVVIGKLSVPAISMVIAFQE